jgi:uncharacterized protein
VLYRELGDTGEKVSILGFGAMRLPILDGKPDNIDVPLATEMLHYAIDAGVNYVDTAYPYHTAAEDRPGASEGFLGAALAGGYREKVLLATKMPHWLTNSREDMDRHLAGQLERLKTDRLDCYLVHGVHAGVLEKLLGLGLVDFLETAKADGRIRFTGFSYHGEPEEFTPAVEAYDWDLCQIQYNYMDTHFQAGEAGLRYAAGKGLGVVVMEPLKGGRLACRVPEEVQAIWDSAPVSRTAAEWALRFVWNDPGVSLLLSGMSTMEQVVGNVEASERGVAGSLTAEEMRRIEQARRIFQERIAIDCTGCRYCMPCPSGVDIPAVFTRLNAASLYGNMALEMHDYGLFVHEKASACAECGECEEKCPQGLAIREGLAQAVRVFES